MDAPNLGSLKASDASDAVLVKLAKAQGMNTDIRKSVFTVLMSSEVRLLVRTGFSGTD